MTMSAAAAIVSTVLVPAILAEAETLGLGGREMFAAYVAGYETWAELARRDPGHHHVKGWHPTGIFGAIGAGAACAALRRLDAGAGDDGDRAVGLAGRRHHGQFRHDDKAVPRRPRGACRARLGAARRTRLYRLARRARTPAGLSVGGVARGRAPTAKARPALGEEWQIVKQGLSIKKYPACYCTHRALDAMLDLLAQAAAEAGRDRAHHRVDQQDAFADPAQPRAADRARSQIQHGVRDGGGGDLAPRQPRRIHRRLCPPPRGAGADAPGGDRHQRELRPAGQRRLGLRPGRRRARRTASGSRARRCAAPAATPSCR